MSATKVIERPRKQYAVLRCGWCKGFIHEERRSDMTRYAHDEPPLTAHEVLPYRPR